MHSESKFHTRRETDPTCLTPAAGYTEGIIGPKILSRQSDSAFTIEYRSCGSIHFRGFARWTFIPTSSKKTSMDYVSVSLYKVTWKSREIS